MISVNQRVDPVGEKRPIFIVGAGGIVKDGHLPAYRKAGFPVAGIFDIDPKKSEDLVAAFPEAGKVYHSIESFLAFNDGQNVVFDVAVPADAIIPVLEKLPRGSAVLIQKPMGEDISEARQIFQLCEERSLAAAVNFQLRHAPFSLAARSLIEQGLIGEVYDVEIMVCVYTPWHLWDFLASRSRVEILYHSIHYVDLVRSFLGNPRKVYASTLKHPHMRELASTRTTMILDFDIFTQARIIANHGHNFGADEQQSYLKIEGTKGAIKARIGVSLNYPNGVPDQLAFVSEATGGRWTELNLVGSWFPDAFVGPMAQVQRLAADSTLDRLEILRDNFQTMRLVEAAYHSSDEGGIYFNDFEE